MKQERESDPYSEDSRRVISEDELLKLRFQAEREYEECSRKIQENNRELEKLIARMERGYGRF